MKLVMISMRITTGPVRCPRPGSYPRSPVTRLPASQEKLSDGSATGECYQQAVRLIVLLKEQSFLARHASHPQKRPLQARSSREHSSDIPVVTLLVVDQLVLDHVDHDLIRHQRALVHDLLGRLAELGLARDLRAEHVARREVADAVLVGDVGRLGALAFCMSALPRTHHDS